MIGGVFKLHWVAGIVPHATIYVRYLDIFRAEHKQIASQDLENIVFCVFISWYLN